MADNKKDQERKDQLEWPDAETHPGVEHGDTVLDTDGKPVVNEDGKHERVFYDTDEDGNVIGWHKEVA